MKNFLFGIIVFLSNLCYSQNKVEINSVDLGLGGFYSYLNNLSDDETGGMILSLSPTVKYKNHLVSLSILFGGGAGSGYFRIGDFYSFQKIDLFYGRELKIVKWISFEPRIGIGYYFDNGRINRYDEKENRAVVNFPINASLIFFTNKKVGVGLSANYNINKLSKTFSGNLFLRFNLVNYNKTK